MTKGLLAQRPASLTPVFGTDPRDYMIYRVDRSVLQNGDEPWLHGP